MIKVSVIIPVYNSEKYLQECLDSVVNQTLSDIEIICINDGSTDNSLNILESYANTYERFIIISQDNKGQGSARNNGLKHANGEYIYFMDSDDIIKPNTLKDNYEICRDKSLDFSMFQLINYDDENEKFYKDDNYDISQLKDLTQETIFSYNDLDDLIFSIPVSPVNKLYNFNFLNLIDAKFPEGVIFEDNIFFWHIFLNAQRICFIQKHYYIRRKHSSSTTTQNNINLIDTFKINNMVIDIFKEHNLFENFKAKLFNRKIDAVYLRFNQVQYNCKKLFFDEMKRDFENMIEEYTYESIFSSLSMIHKIIFNSVINSRGFEEAILLINNEILISDIKKFKSNNKKLKKEIKSIKKENELIASSTSWKITKPFRFFKKKFKVIK